MQKTTNNILTILLLSILILSTVFLYHLTNQYQESNLTQNVGKSIQISLNNIEKNTNGNFKITPPKSNQDNFSYVIITSPKFKYCFQPLIDYKSSYVSSRIMTVKEIIENKSFWVNGTYGDGTNCSEGNPWIKSERQVKNNFQLFNDTSAKIRNFIRFAYSQWDTKYILLGGDTEIIPYRSFYGYIPNWSAGKIVKSIQASIVSDLYYAALNGTWNDDFDSYFGEEATFSITDEADFTAEVFIGRAPVNDKHEVNVFVEKVISYETSEKPKEVQLHQSYTNPQHIPDTTKVLTMCQRWIPEEYTIHRLYEKDELITAEQWKNSFSNPEKLLLFHVGNGYNDGLYSWYQLCWDGNKRVKFNVLNAGELRNSFYPIHLSISCLTGDFSENECLAEELLLTRNGGPSACIANSEVGCISRDDAGAYSAEFFEQIFKNIFQNTSARLGSVVQQAKDHFAIIAPYQRKYRWCFYELTLLGDPETPVFQVRKRHSNSTQTVIVDDDFNPSEEGFNKTKFNSIQSAIDYISPYGKISINAGIYKEKLFINKTITINGIDKSSVILSKNKDDTSSLINLYCHSTTISNLSILCNSNHTKKSLSLVKINDGCNGNNIINTTLIGQGQYGILITNAIRNTIENNTISSCDFGLGIITNLEGLFPSKVVITCDNIIRHNIFENNSECGLIIQGSLHNFIFDNAFLNNGKNYFDSKGFFNAENEHIRLIKTKLNHINNNYWGKPRSEPYRIDSFNGPITIFTFDLSRGLIFQLYKCILIINLGYPTVVYDQNPAQSPYGI